MSEGLARNEPAVPAVAPAMTTTPIQDAKAKNSLPPDGTPCRTTATLGSTTGMLIAQHRLDDRVPDTDGVTRGWVSGHGGDVWWVEHEDGTTGAYTAHEVKDRRQPLVAEDVPAFRRPDYRRGLPRGAPQGPETSAQTVRLTSGRMVVKPLVALVSEYLRRWFDGGLAGACVFSDAVKLARDPGFEPRSTTMPEIDEAFLENGRMHRDLREIIKCSVVGEGYDMSLVSPLHASQEQPQSVKDDIIKRRADRESVDDIAYTHGMTNGDVQAIIVERAQELLRIAGYRGTVAKVENSPGPDGPVLLVSGDFTFGERNYTHVVVSDHGRLTVGGVELPEGGR